MVAVWRAFGEGYKNAHDVILEGGGRGEDRKEIMNCMMLWTNQVRMGKDPKGSREGLGTSGSRFRDCHCRLFLLATITAQNLRNTSAQNSPGNPPHLRTVC